MPSNRGNRKWIEYHDQHALHEIILYHEIGTYKLQIAQSTFTDTGDGRIEPQGLFSIISLKSVWGTLGLEVEEFGQHTIVDTCFRRF